MVRSGGYSFTRKKKSKSVCEELILFVVLRVRILVMFFGVEESDFTTKRRVYQLRPPELVSRGRATNEILGALHAIYELGSIVWQPPFLILLISGVN